MVDAEEDWMESEDLSSSLRALDGVEFGLRTTHGRNVLSDRLVECRKGFECLIGCCGDCGEWSDLAFIMKDVLWLC
jgi:hypothetical protein